MKRIYLEFAKQHLAEHEQMLFLEGPRQVGKTTIAKKLGQLYTTSSYLNWDNLDDQSIMIAGPKHLADHIAADHIAAEKQLLLLDEIQKHPRWKNFIKGFYDTYKDNAQLVLTGSSKLTTYKKGGDSLMGRYFPCHIHPFSIAECIRHAYTDQEIQAPKKIDDDLFSNLLEFGGFPDPLLKGSKTFYTKWSKLRFDQLIREDIRDLTQVRALGKMEMLAKLLEHQAGSLLNYSSLAKKVGASNETVQHWINILQDNYYCFLIQPWSRNISRSLLKNPKPFLWDWSLVKDPGSRYENFVACHLLKAIHFWEDLGLGEYGLYFLRDKEKREVDFLVTKNNKPWFITEVKASKKTSLSQTLHHYQKLTNAKHAFQVVFDMEYVEKDCFSYHTPMIVPAQTFLSQLV